MRARRGFTVLEMLVAVFLLLIITGASVQFLRKQTGLVTRETSRMDAMQNAEFAASQVERELREAGAGVTDAQPMVVQLDTSAITFNANMVSIDTGDVKAVYQLKDADTNATRVMFKTENTALPNSSPAVGYPDTTYYAAKGAPSNAETITYYLRPDSTSTLTKRYMLLRRVNGLAPTLVARGIVRDSRDTMPVFTYYTTDANNRLVPVPRALLPLYHVMIHGAQNDTGANALTDSIKAVRLHFLTATRDPKTGKDALRTVETMVRLMNSGLLEHSSCGQPPLAPGIPVTLASVPPASPSVTLTWGASTDDNGGEKDTERYAIYRRPTTATVFSDPIVSIPSSLKATYTWTDNGVVSGQSYVYGVATQDCTPNISAVSVSAVVTVP